MFADDCDLYGEQVEVSFGKRGKGNIFEKWNAEEIANGRNSLQEAPLHVLPLTRVLCDPWWSQMRTKAPSSDLSNVLTAPAEAHSAWFWCRSLAGLCGGKCLDDVRGSEQSIARALELYSPDFSVWVSGGIIVALQQSPLIQWVWQWAHVGFVSARLPAAFLSSPFTRAGSCL